MHGRTIILHLFIILCFFYLLYLNKISLKSPKIILALFFILAFCKNGLNFTLRKTHPAKTGAAGSFSLGLSTYIYLYIKLMHGLDNDEGDNH